MVGLEGSAHLSAVRVFKLGVANLHAEAEQHVELRSRDTWHTAKGRRRGYNVTGWAM